MLFKSIRLKNFRQFKDLYIEFSLDPIKNVTIVSGNNGAGKTTLAQAFTWCLYGETSFKISSLLNKESEINIMNKFLTDVEVVLEIIHGEVMYIIDRRQTYSINNYGKIKSENSVVKISKKTKDGKFSVMREGETKSTIEKILPNELSRYFLFDGERIEKMSKEIQGGKKSNEFSEAVKGLLGLAPLIKAKEHMSPTSKFAVIGMYKNEFEDEGNNKILTLTEKIEKREVYIEKKKKRREEISDEINSKEKLIKNNEEKLKEFEEPRRLQNHKLILEANILRNKNDIINGTKRILFSINKDLNIYTAKGLIKSIAEEIKEENYDDKGIPDMHSKTIEFLLKRGRCLCGKEILPSSEEYKVLMELKNFLPPHSVGVSIKYFLSNSRIRITNERNLYNMVKEEYKKIIYLRNVIEDDENEVLHIEKEFLSKNMDVEINNICQENENYKIDLKKLRKEDEELIGGIAAVDREREILISQKTREMQKNEKNRKIELYKSYAEKIYEDLSLILDTREKYLREKLEVEIDNIFNKIYNGGLNISIDEKYGISVHAKKYITETSTAQSISVIFSFISGIIKMAREYQNNKDNSELLSEAYPLVMDAPLSAFDKQRINNVCAVLPNIAEQIIIFIKDTDGDIAKENLENKIGNIYILEKVNEFYTKLM